MLVQSDISRRQVSSEVTAAWEDSCSDPEHCGDDAVTQLCRVMFPLVAGSDVSDWLPTLRAQLRACMELDKAIGLVGWFH